MEPRLGAPVDWDGSFVTATSALVVMTCEMVLLPLTVMTVVTICCVLLETGACVVRLEGLVTVAPAAADDDACCEEACAADEDGAWELAAVDGACDEA